MEKSVSHAIAGRRSVRRFTTAPVERSRVDLVLNAARLAPSWCNSQCWRFVVLDNPQAIANLEKPECCTAPVVIVACAAKGVSGERAGKAYSLVDMGLALQNMSLQADALGLGTVIVGWFDETKVKGLLGVPDGYDVVALLALGYPDEAPDARPRKPLHEIACWGEWSL